MIFYNIKELENQLRANKLPKRHVFIYAMILLTISNLSAFRFGSDEPVDLWINNAEVLLVAIITIGFTIHLYSLCSESNREEYFFDYYFSIGMVIFVRLFVLSLLIIPPCIFIFIFVFPNGLGGYDSLADLFMTAGLGIIYYYFMVRSFSRVLGN